MLFRSQQAQQLIRAGRVRAGDRLLDKPGVAVDPLLMLQVEQPPRFVSRGGEKLLGALAVFPLALEGRVCLDGGISTGGFTDCLLQHGATRVYGVDVGYGQTAWSLRTDPRLVLKERTNLRHLQPDDLYGPEDPWPDLAVADVSFIRLALVLPALGRLLRPERREALLLVKPLASTPIRLPRPKYSAPPDVTATFRVNWQSFTWGFVPAPDRKSTRLNSSH